MPITTDGDGWAEGQTTKGLPASTRKPAPDIELAVFPAPDGWRWAARQSGRCETEAAARVAAESAAERMQATAPHKVPHAVRQGQTPPPVAGLRREVHPDEMAAAKDRGWVATDTAGLKWRRVIPGMELRISLGKLCWVWLILIDGQTAASNGDTAHATFAAAMADVEAAAEGGADGVKAAAEARRAAKAARRAAAA